MLLCLRISKESVYFSPVNSDKVSCHLNSEVYDVLVKEGTIVPKPHKAPPTVPMDYQWAQVWHVCCCGGGGGGGVCVFIHILDSKNY